ncbi:hypothetical protein BCR44DRAFT_46619 [Catenaria anguillulae PL171]|uniref:BTB domain-containing protein n=1 Tax=Catenaria anguillulae PL171 TaxID=765915 RepID=A0A1Y2HFZ2_9FUNG|nr:hypothetical protein BCR44DRAFT_46619 [Catenaria anguillulae PL171]
MSTSTASPQQPSTSAEHAVITFAASDSRQEWQKVDQSTATHPGKYFDYHIVVRSSVSKVVGAFDLFLVIDKASTSALAPFDTLSIKLTIVLDGAMHYTVSVYDSYPRAQKLQIDPITVTIDLVSLSQGSTYFKTFKSKAPTGTRSTEFSFKRATVTLHEAVGPKPTHLASLSRTLDTPALCDCALVPNDSKLPIHVSRAILAQASPFFATMFNGNWSESSANQSRSAADPMPFNWPARAIVLCLVHIYSGWVAGQSLPKFKTIRRVCKRYSLDVETLNRHAWVDVLDLAQMLGLTRLAQAANRVIVRLMDHEHHSLLAAGVGDIPDESEESEEDEEVHADASKPKEATKEGSKE